MNDKLAKIPEVLPPEEEYGVEIMNDPETIEVRGKVVPTDLRYSIMCPDVMIQVTQMGTRTSVRVESLTKYEGEDDLFIEARCNTIPTKEALDQMIIKVKLAFDAIYKGQYE